MRVAGGPNPRSARPAELLDGRTNTPGRARPAEPEALEASKVGGDTMQPPPHEISKGNPLSARPCRACRKGLWEGEACRAGSIGSIQSWRGYDATPAPRDLKVTPGARGPPELAGSEESLGTTLAHPLPQRGQMSQLGPKRSEGPGLDAHPRRRKGVPSRPQGGHRPGSPG